MAPETMVTAPTLTRRQFLYRAVYAGVGLVAASGGYGVVEAHRVEVTRPKIELKGLPEGLAGFTIAVLTDIHHSPIMPLWRVRQVVDLTNSLKPDLIALVGDYVWHGAQHIAPVFGELKRLRAPYGVFGVLGNHDYWDGPVETRAAMAAAGIAELTNRHARITTPRGAFFLAGVDDAYFGKPDADLALQGVPEDAASVLLVHTPVYVAGLGKRRPGLLLAGHTHGGQVVIPFIGPPFLPGEDCRPYVSGLIRHPNGPVYVSRGIGYAGVPIRLNCPPELPLITLCAPSENA